MNKQLTSSRTLAIALFMIAIAVIRVTVATTICSPMSTFTPIGAMALFGGAYFSRYKSFLFPLFTLWISDIAISGFCYHKWELFYMGFYWTYGAFALMALIGKWMKPERSLKQFILSTIVVVLIHWIVTDFGVWYIGDMYPKTLTGFWTCLVVAIPFEINFLAGTTVYGALMFGGFALLQNRFQSVRAISK